MYARLLGKGRDILGNVFILVYFVSVRSLKVKLVVDNLYVDDVSLSFGFDDEIGFEAA